jgi:hypothetical protein
LVPVALAHTRLIGFVTTRFANVPVVALTVPKVALEAVMSGAKTDDPEMVPAEEMEPAVTVPRFVAPVTVRAAMVVVARFDDPAMVRAPVREKLEPEPLVKARF